MQQFLCCGWNLPVIFGEASKYSLLKRLVCRKHFKGHCVHANLSHYCMISILEFWGVIWHIIPVDWMIWSLWTWFKHQNSQGSCKCIIEAIETPSHWLRRWIAASPSFDNDVPFGGRCHALITNLWETRQKNMTERNGIIDTARECNSVEDYVM